MRISRALHAIAPRCADRALRGHLPGPLAAWMQRVEALPYFLRTWPAHWK